MKKQIKKTEILKITPKTKDMKRKHKNLKVGKRVFVNSSKSKDKEMQKLSDYSSDYLSENEENAFTPGEFPRCRNFRIFLKLTT